MSPHIRVIFFLLSCAFAAGVVGGLINFVIAPLFGLAHITSAFGCAINPGFHKVDLYQKAFWGGLWGLLFLVPLRKGLRNIWLTAAVYGFFPSLVQIFVVFPLATPFGIGGIRLGVATPLFVLLFNTIGWSIPGYLWFVTCNPPDADELDDFFNNPLLGS